MEILERLEKSR